MGPNEVTLKNLEDAKAVKLQFMSLVGAASPLVIWKFYDPISVAFVDTSGIIKYKVRPRSMTS